MIEPFEIPLTEHKRRTYLVDPDTGCWVWQGSKAISGHGKISVGDNLEYHVAHRAYWMHYMGRAIKPKHILHHLCRNPSCVNPEHLIEVTRKEHAKYHPNPRRKFTDNDVENIRSLYAMGWPPRWIREFYPCGESTFARIVKGESYQ